MIVYKPKADFEQSIGIQEQYVQLLKTLHAELMIKRRKTNGLQHAKLSVELHELSTKLDLQISLLTEKTDHFNKHFIPSYDAELSECGEKFDAIVVKSYEYVESNEKNEISTKIANALKAFTELDGENQGHIEVQNVVYKDLKTLLSLVD
tara:strand:+ start:2510 stop:2959 length:450 start_codon:yes stop_codon:yes gene_type:complete